MRIDLVGAYKLVFHARWGLLTATSCLLLALVVLPLATTAQAPPLDYVCHDIAQPVLTFEQLPEISEIQPAWVTLGEPQQIPVVVENRGNGAIEFLIATPEEEDNRRVFLPSGFLTVESEVHGDQNVRTILIEYRADEIGREEVSLRATGWYAHSPDLALEDQEITILVETVEAPLSNSIEELPFGAVPLLVVGLLAEIIAHRCPRP